MFILLFFFCCFAQVVSSTYAFEKEKVWKKQFSRALLQDPHWENKTTAEEVYKFNANAIANVLKYCFRCQNVLWTKLKKK